MGAAESAEKPRGAAHEADLGFTLDEAAQFGMNAPLSVRRFISATKTKEILQSVFFGTVYGQYLFLATCAMTLLVTGTIAWTFGSVGIEGYDTSLTHSIWLSYTMFIDTGTQTGVYAFERDTVKLIVVALSGFGLLFNLTFLSVVVDNVRSLLDRLYTRYAQLFARDHVVILGWTSKTLFLIDELISMFEDAGGKGDIVIMGDHSRYEMLREIELTFRRRNPPKPSGVRIRVWEGDVAEEDDLTRLSINAARFVVCLSESADPRIADTQVLETLLSLQSLDDDDQVRGTVIAEVRTSDALSVVAQLNQSTDHDVLAVLPARAVDQVLALMALQPSVGETLVELISFTGHNFFFEAVAPELVGRTFGECTRRYPLCVLCGLHKRPRDEQGRPSGAKVLIAPHPGHVLEPTDRLLLIGVDRGSTIVVSQEGAPAGTMQIANSAKLRFAQLMWRIRRLRMNRQSRRARAAARAASERKAEWLAGQKPAREFSMRQVVLILGWKSAREMADMVRSLTKMLLPGSELHFLSAVDVDTREAALASEFDLLSAISGLAGLRSGPRDDILIKHHLGSTLAGEAYAKLPLERASVGIVLGDPAVIGIGDDVGSYSEGAARLKDARVFHISTLLRMKAPDLRIVPIYEDVHSHRLITDDSPLVMGDANVSQRGSGITAVFHRNSLETGLIAMQADDPTLVFVFSQLLATEAEAKYFAVPFQRAVEDLGVLADGEAAPHYSFGQLAQIILERQGHILIGYYDQSTRDVTINPEDKRQPTAWEGSDELLLLRGHTAAGGQTPVANKRLWQ